MKTITTLGTILAAAFTINAATAAVPQTGRVDFSERAGIERPAEVQYQTGRVDQGSHKGIFSNDGRSATDGRQG